MFKKALGIGTCLVLHNLPGWGQQIAHVDSIPSSTAFSHHEYHIQVPLGQTFVKSGGCHNRSTIRYHVPDPRSKPVFSLDTIGKVLVPMIAMGSAGTTFQRSVTTMRGATTMTVSRSSVTIDDDPARYLMELKADPTVPTKMVMNLGYGSAWLDLSGMDVRYLDIQSANADVFITYKSLNTHPMGALKLNAGMAKLVVRNLELARAENIIVENGMGVTKLIIGDKPYQRSNVSINVGSGSCIMLVGREYPIKVVLKSSMFSKVEMPEDMIETTDNTFVNLAYKSNPQDAMVVVVDVSMGTFSFVLYE